MIRLAALGAVQVFRDGVEVDLDRRPQLMLALLLARAGQTVGVNELIDLLWGTDPPVNAVNMVRRHVGVIRRAFEPGLPFRAAGSWLAGVPGGYRLRAGPDTADVLEFRALVERASTAPTPALAVPDWVAALSLWRGRYAQGLARSGTLPAAFAAVDEERAAAALAAAQAALRAGAATTVLPLVRAVAEANPLDESLAAGVIQLLTADGRVTAAADWYRRTRDALDEHLGVPPGPALAAAYQQVTEALEPAAPVAMPPSATPPEQLPADLRLFGGRRVEMAALTAALSQFAGTAGVIAIDGIPGVGKSTLAVHWAHSVEDRFPDGRLFVNLRGYAPTGEPADPHDVLAGFLDALGVPPAAVPPDTPSRAALFRQMAAGCRLLVVLDNARDIEQVRPLMPGSVGSLVLITSRTRFGGLSTREGAMLLALDLPDIDDAREDLRRRAGTQGGYSDQDLDRIVAYCGRLPLAVAVVAARARGRVGGIAGLLAELEGSRDSLDAFDDDALGGVRAVFSWSYRRLSPQAARLFRLLPLQTGSDSAPPLLASLAAEPRSAIDPLIRELLRTRLISEPRPGRFGQHDLLAVYAAELSAEIDTATEREQAADRVLDHYTQALNTMNMRHLDPVVRTIDTLPMPGVEPLDFPDSRSALDWLRGELENLGGAWADQFARGRSPWRTIADAFPAYNRLRVAVDLERPAEMALAAARWTGDRVAEGHLGIELAWLAGQDQRDDEMRTGLEAALAIFEELGAGVEQALAQLQLAMSHALAEPPDYAGATPFYERALRLFRDHNHEAGITAALVGLGRCQLELGRTEQGVTTLTEALERNLGRGRLYHAAAEFWHIGTAGHRADAIDFLLMARRLYADGGSVFWEMKTGLALAEAYFEADRRWDALAAWRQANDRFRVVAEGGETPTGLREQFARLGERLRQTAADVESGTEFNSRGKADAP
ncbi:BTAD domain-containing putative transcriptional regulator [Micromonospora ureilytica]|uniref:AfsR/SARP family transcriptional regulator n=1 Tax=Micromonospora ureilytica TaxID=709868 RepID=UPI0033F01F2A